MSIGNNEQIIKIRQFLNKQQTHPLRTVVVTYLRDQNKHMSVLQADARTHRDRDERTVQHWTHWTTGRHERTKYVGGFVFTLALLGSGYGA